MTMRSPSFISGRLYVRGRSAVAAIAVSYLVMIVALAISGGFRVEIRNSIADLVGDMRISEPGMGPGDETSPAVVPPQLRDAIENAAGVDSLREVIYSAAVVKGGENVHGVVFKGIESGDSASLVVRVPRNLASMLELKEGDRMLSYFIGERVVLRNFTVSGIYDAISTGDGMMVVLCDINTLRRINGWDAGTVSALEVILEDGFRSDESSAAVCSNINGLLMMNSDEDESTLCCTLSSVTYGRIFDWLRLIDSNVAFILVLMTVVAGLNMVIGLLILLFENIRTIGLLKSLGMRTRDIAETFLRSSARLVLKGLAIGNALALLLCLIESKTRIFALDPDNYFVNFVPVSLDIPLLVICDVLSFAVIMLILLIPCTFISKVDPAQTMRQG